MYKFKEYYINSLIRDPNEDYLYDNSDEWFDDHKATTSRGSFVLGIVDERNVNNFQQFIDIEILPMLFDNIKQNMNKEIVFLTNESETEKYIFESICRKFPQKTFVSKKASNNIIKDIQTLEFNNKIALAILESSKIFSIKYLIEYI